MGLRPIEPINIERFRLPTPQVWLQRRLIPWPSATTCAPGIVIWPTWGDVGIAGRPRDAKPTAAWVSEVVPWFTLVVALESGPGLRPKVQGNTCAARDLARRAVTMRRESTAPSAGVRGSRAACVLGPESATPAGGGEWPGVPVAGVAGVARVANCRSKMFDIAAGINLDASDAVAVKRSVCEAEVNIDVIIDACRK